MHEHDITVGSGAPGSSFGAQAPSYGAPRLSHGAPGPAYGAPRPASGAPGPSYGAPGLQPRRRPSPLALLPLLAIALAVPACSRQEAPAAPASEAAAPKDAQHAGITEPHGDHTPQHGGMVLMNGDVHYELVMDAAGKYEVWFTDAIRTELPASVASNVRLQVTRASGAAETVTLAIDEAGESWIGQGQPAGEGAMIKLNYDLRGEPHEVETPFVAAKR